MFPPGLIPASLVVLPAGGHWSVVLRAPFSANVQINCPPLPPGQALDWWHEALGIAAFDPNRGAGIRIGVIDTGCGPEWVPAASQRRRSLHRGDASPRSRRRRRFHMARTSAARSAPGPSIRRRSGAASRRVPRCSRRKCSGRGYVCQPGRHRPSDRRAVARTPGRSDQSEPWREPAFGNRTRRDRRRAAARHALHLCRGQHRRRHGVAGRFPETVGVTAIGFKDAPAPKGTLSANRVPTQSRDARQRRPVPRELQQLRVGRRRDRARRRHHRDRAGTIRTAAAVCRHGRHVDGQSGRLRRARRAARRVADLSGPHRLRPGGGSAGNSQTAIARRSVWRRSSRETAFHACHNAATTDMPDEERFVLAPKRSRRDALRADWLDIVRATPGVTILGDANPVAVQISRVGRRPRAAGGAVRRRAQYRAHHSPRTFLIAPTRPRPDDRYPRRQYSSCAVQALCGFPGRSVSL